MFSIIIPLYNKQHSVKRCITSILNQSFKNFEIIVINDGSTDESLAEVLSIKDERIHVVNKQNEGVVKARNLGISLSNNPLISFLDADDYWYSTHLETIYNLYNDFPDAGIYTTKYLFYHSEKKQILPYFIGIPDENWRGVVENYFDSSYVYRLGCTGSNVIPKKVFEKIGYFDETLKISPYGEDIKLWIKIALSYPVVYDSKVTFIYDLSGENHLSKNDIKKRSYATFEEFESIEKTNKSLKRYLDLFRTEFALKNKIGGNIKTYLKYKNEIDVQNLNWKIKILFSLPSGLLKRLYTFKQYLEDKKIVIDIHH
ncbi:glycosyltransferase family 2 protein [Flavobacterium microcysteis]|uniref:Glycosyltransferase family 2 protein n=1 Tax=Flavobacterium microcysteis TaxID=2596891 RepID=A0A501QIN7_9FLAO|nr:glycosyltransferase family A protein [Flavobacterium microcysteis]TPD71957.1 glycosyltransferase family 2 protein [Flavobacterium microcysteis]